MYVEGPHFVIGLCGETLHLRSAINDLLERREFIVGIALGIALPPYRCG